MASIHKEFIIDAPAESVWPALEDVGNVHTRLVPDLVIDCVLEDDLRVITFANGLVVRELIVDIDDDRRRVAYSADGARMTHHHASMQLIEEEGDRTRLIWTADLLPESARCDVSALMDKGSEIMQRHLSQLKQASI